MTTRSALSALALLLVSACSPPQATETPTPPEAVSVSPAAILFSGGWAAVTPNGAKVGAGYVTITNPTGSPDKLVSAESPRASHTEIHEMKMDGAMMKMSQVDGLTIPAHGAVELRPGGYHVMFIEIAEPFRTGDSIPVRLTFERAGAQNIILPIRERTESDMRGAGDMGMKNDR